MAFLVQAVRQGTTYNLYGRTSYAFVRLRGIGSPDLRNVTRVGPQQHGATFLDYRLQPRQMVLELMLLGATDAAVDATRRQLVDIFHPAQSTQLKFTTDDSSVRYLDVRLAGPMVDYAVGPEERHTAAQLLVRVPVIAHEPAFYASSWATSTFNSTNGDAQNGFSAYPDNDVVEYELNPSVGDAWSGSDIGEKQPWTVAFVLGTGSNDGEILWRASASVNDIYCIRSGGNILLNIPLLGELSTGVAAAADTYIFSCDGDQITTYKGGVASSTLLPWYSDFPVSTGIWREAFAGYGSDLSALLVSAQVHNKALNALQTAILDEALTTSSVYNVTGRVTYAGSWRSYPILILEAGASNLVDPVIYLTNNNRKISFSGATITANDERIIDTRPQKWTVRDSAGANKYSELVDGSNLNDFYLLPDTIITDGENGFAVGYTSGATPTLNVVYDTFYLGL